MKRLDVRQVLLGLSTLLLAVTSAHGTYTVYQTGFEPLAFSTGNLHGQDSWSTWGIASRVTVQDAVAKSGLQAVKIDRSYHDTAAYEGAIRGYGYDALNQVITLRIDALLTAPANQQYSHWTVLDAWFGDEFVHINVDWTGQIYVCNLGPIRHDTSAWITRNAWNSFQQVLDFRSRIATVYYNGAEIYSGAFGGSSNVVESVAFAGQWDYTDDIGYFDNFSMRSDVPEPSAVGLVSLAIGAVLLGCWRRRR